MDVYGSLKELRNKRRKISVIKAKINRVNKKHDERVMELKTKLYQLDKDLVDLQNSQLFNVRLGDLVLEIANLSGVMVSDIEVCLETNVSLIGEHSFEEMVDLFKMNNKLYVLRMCLKGDKVIRTNGSKFHYFTFLPLDLNNIMSFCSASINVFGDERYTCLEISNNIVDIILTFDISFIEGKDNVSWYPADLFSTAIINCIRKKKNIGLVKKLKR